MIDQGLIALDRSRRVLLATDRAKRMLGISDDVTGETLAAKNVDYRVIRLLDATAASGRVEERELEIGERELVARALALDTNDVAMLLLIRDETRVRHLERVRRDFVSNVSHELRTPVTAVRLMAETLENGGLEDPTAAADFVRRIGLEAAHLGQMVEELLELSTIESGLRPMAHERVPTAALISSIDRLRPIAEQKGVVIETTLLPGTPDIVGDAARLGQVTRNLVHNAIKFTPAGGRIEMEAGAGKTGWVRLRCRDTGVGINLTDLPRIFERFWKADSSRQRDGEGSGLGLAIVRHVVEAHGGRVAVASEPRVGTEFTVDLPAAPAAT